MAIGDTVQAGLMRVDFSPFLEAGRANAAANASFGNALGTIAKGYFEGQEKKARSEEITGYLMNQGASEKDAKAISKNPFLQKQYQQQKQTEAQMKMEERRLATQANIAAQGRAASQAQIDQKYKREDDAKASVEQEVDAFNDRLNDFVPTDELTPEAQQRIDSFSSTTAPTDPRRLAQVNDPQAFMERVKNDPTSYVKKPVYELQGGDFLSQFEDPGMFQKAMAFDQKRQAAQPKAMTPKEELDYFVKLNNEIRDQAAEERKTSEFEEENKPLPPADPVYKEAAINAIDSAVEKSKGFFATGITGQALQGFAGTDARDLAQAISTVEAAVGFDRLQEMRDSSKTGGALGAINTKELELLSSSLGSLDPLQKPETLRKNLESIKEKYVKILKSVEAEKYAFENDITFKTPKEAMDFVNNFNPSSPQQTANTIDPADIQSEIDRKKQMIRDRDLQNKYFDNPNIQNLGNVNQGN
jgi:hypothetical protein